MSPQWQPESNDAGSKAAIIAADAARRQPPRSSAPPSSWGNSAANQAFKAGRTQQRASESKPLDRQGSLRAAKGAMAGARPRSQSSPLSTKQGRNDESASANALSAATIAHRPSVRANNLDIPQEEAGAVPFTVMDRRMYTSNPPVKPEVDEKNRQDVLHASAVAMAKRMYSQQQKVIEQTRLAHGDDSNDEPQPMIFNNLQEAAYRQAQERLAKLHEEHQKNRDIHDYYGTSTANQRKFSVRGKLRRRSSSDTEVMEDTKRSQQIRQQMSMFSNNLTKVDEQKRQKDREAVLAAAQRNVKARLQGMDDKLFQETGRVAPSLLSEWELKAHAAAQARSDARKDENYGKVDIGGGKFMDQQAVDEIAAKRVQPVLDEINEKAEIERERQAALKLEQEKRQEEIDTQKARDKEIKDIHRKLKGMPCIVYKSFARESNFVTEQEKAEEKARKEELKQEEKNRKEEEKAAKAEQKRIAKEEKHKSKDKDVDTAPVATDAAVESPSEPSPVVEKAAVLVPRPVTPQQRTNTKDSDDKSSDLPEEAAASPSHKVRNWLKSRFSRPRAKSSSVDESANKQGFIGGAALTGLHADGTGSMTSLEQRSASMREVAMAGKQPAERTSYFAKDEPGESSKTAEERGRDAEVSSLSSDDETFDDANDTFSPPKAIKDPATSRRSSGSPSRDSRFREIIE